MNGSTFKVTVALTLVFLGGILAFSPLPEEVAREGHRILWVIEAVWFLQEHKRTIGGLWSTNRFRKKR